MEPWCSKSRMEELPETLRERNATLSTTLSIGLKGTLDMLDRCLLIISLQISGCGDQSEAISAHIRHHLTTPVELTLTIILEVKRHSSSKSDYLPSFADSFKYF